MAASSNITAPHRWGVLTNRVTSMISRFEQYAEYTIPKLCPRDGYDTAGEEISHAVQAVGAQSTNHLVNKIMLASFAPSRPFFRLDLDYETKKQMAAAKMDEHQIAAKLAATEKEAAGLLDRKNVRPKLTEIIKHLVVLGNVLIELHKGGIRVIGIKNYRVRRAYDGTVAELITCDKMLFDELDDKVQEHIKTLDPHKQPEVEVKLYRWIKKVGKYYVMTQWVDAVQLPEEFDGKWPLDKCPFQVLTWDLIDGQHYGTGLVEDYAGDFYGLTMLSEAQLQAAILSSQFKWLANPAGQTKPEDFANSVNGAVLAGNEGDLTLVQSGKAHDLNVVLNIQQDYIARIARGFLVNSAITRDAERVTAEEIRMQATELETSLGGAYSRLAVDLQLPIAYWLMEQIGSPIQGTAVQPSVVTGLDALSRSGDLENIKLFLMDLTALGSVPEDIRARMRIDSVIGALATGRRLDPDSLLLTQEEIAQLQAQMLAQQQEQQAMAAGIDVAAEAASAEVTGEP